MPYRSYFLALLGFNLILILTAGIILLAKWNAVSNIFRRWQNSPILRRDVQRHKQTLYQQNFKAGSIIMLGNSLTEQAEWAELLGRPDIVNRGISGETSAEVLQRLPELLLAKPGKICLMVGINDLLYHGKHGGYILRNLEQMVTLCKQSHVPVLLQSLLPTQFDTKVNQQIKRINVSISNLALKEKETCQYLALYPHLEKGGRLDESCTYDGLHLTAEGYRRWAVALQPFLPAPQHISAAVDSLP